MKKSKKNGSQICASKLKQPAIFGGKEVISEEKEQIQENKESTNTFAQKKCFLKRRKGVKGDGCGEDEVYLQPVHKVRVFILCHVLTKWQL